MYRVHVHVQVSVVTDKDDNEWIQAFKKEGTKFHAFSVPSCYDNRLT